MPSHDYKNNPQNLSHYCYQEARLSTMETKLQNKKENLHEVHEDYYHLRDKLDAINLNVAELTAIIKENSKKGEENDRKIEELQVELAKINSSIDTLKYLIPIVCAVFTFIINYLI